MLPYLSTCTCTAYVRSIVAIHSQQWTVASKVPVYWNSIIQYHVRQTGRARLDRGLFLFASGLQRHDKYMRHCISTPNFFAHDEHEERNYSGEASSPWSSLHRRNASVARLETDRGIARCDDRTK